MALVLVPGTLARTSTTSSQKWPSIESVCVEDRDAHPGSEIDKPKRACFPTNDPAVVSWIWQGLPPVVSTYSSSLSRRSM